MLQYFCRFRLIRQLWQDLSRDEVDYWGLPLIIHATPANFGEKNSQAIIGIQMASAYVGSSIYASGL